MKWTIAFISLILFSCELFEKDDKDGDKLKPQPNERNFWVLDHTKNKGDDGRFYQLETYKAYDDSTTIIYAQSDPNLLSEANALKMGKEFTSFIKPKVEEIFGGASDIDNNQRIILLVLISKMVRRLAVVLLVVIFIVQICLAKLRLMQVVMAIFEPMRVKSYILILSSKILHQNLLFTRLLMNINT
jgi:hypothetical protein